MPTKKATDYPLPDTLVIGEHRVDARTLSARRYKGVCGDLASDMGGAPSTGQWLLIGRAAGLTVQLEQLECSVAAGKPIDTEVYTALTGSLVRVLRTLGLARRARDVSPTVLDLDPHTAALTAPDPCPPDGPQSAGEFP